MTAPWVRASRESHERLERACERVPRSGNEMIVVSCCATEARQNREGRSRKGGREH